MPINNVEQRGGNVIAYSDIGTMLFAVRGRLKAYARGWVAVEHQGQIVAYDEKGILTRTSAIDGWGKGARR